MNQIMPHLPCRYCKCLGAFDIRVNNMQLLTCLVCFRVESFEDAAARNYVWYAQNRWNFALAA